MTARAVYLHIGAPKTGTSYLQRMIWLNKVELRAQGFFFPPGSRRHQFDAVADLRGGWWADRDLSATWDLLAERVQTRDGVAVISEELLCATPPHLIERIATSLAPVPIHVIHAARDLGRQVPAEWQQALRARSPMTYEAYVQRLKTDADQAFWQVQDPSMVYRRWSEVLEPRSFHVLTVPRPGAAPRLLWERFCSIIGADPLVPHAPEGVQNQSLGLAEAELLRRVNARLGSRFPMRDPYIRVVRDYLMRGGLFSQPKPQKIGVPDEYVEWVEERSQQMVSDLRALSGSVDVVGDPEELAAHVVRAERAPSDQTDEELLEAALEAWIRQLALIDTELDEAATNKLESEERMAELRERAEAAERALARRPLRRVRSAVARRVRG